MYDPAPQHNEPQPPVRPVPPVYAPQPPVHGTQPPAPPAHGAQPLMPPGDEMAVEARVGRGIGQLLMLGFGVLLLVLGGIAASKTGFNVLDVAEQHTTVAGLHFTSLMAIINIVMGFAMVVNGARTNMQWSSMRIFGALGVAFGVVLVAEPSAMHTALGAHAATGFVYGGMGLVLMVVSIVYPMMVADRSQTD